MKLTTLVIAAALAAGCSVHGDERSFMVGTKVVPATPSTAANAIGCVYDATTPENVFGAFDPAFGYVHAVVQTVASETREGHLRVELALDPSQSSPVALEHGLPGAVEVETERVAPAALLFRALGRTVTASNARPDPASAPERGGT